MREPEYAQLKADFIHELWIAQQHTTESPHRLERPAATKYLTQAPTDNPDQDAPKRLKRLTSSLQTAKATLTTRR